MAIGIVVDTNRYIDYTRGVPEAVERIRSADRVLLPIIAIAELRAGFLGGSRSEKNEAVLARFLREPRAGTLAPDEDTTHHYARLFFQLRRQGTPIPTNDLWIAALVVQHGLLLYARDRHFDLLPQLPRA